MNADIRKLRLLAPKWWNPLFWLFVALAPFAGAVVGLAVGTLAGYEQGMKLALGEIRKFMSDLP